MSWTPDRTYLSGIDFFDDIVRGVDAQSWTRPSPCARWTVTDVLGHVGSAVAFGTRLLRGEQPSWHPVDPPGQAVSGSPDAWWSAMADGAKSAVAGVDLAAEVDSGSGRRSIGQGLSFPAVDLFVHGWDIARSVGRDVRIPDEAIAFAHEMLDAFPTEQIRSPRVFGDPAAAPDGATPTQRFIAWTGRDPEWQAPA